MAVKNARNFVRDVNTRKICYSFCHLEMVALVCLPAMLGSSLSYIGTANHPKENSSVKKVQYGLKQFEILIKNYVDKTR